jgi:elongation factor G
MQGTLGVSGIVQAYSEGVNNSLSRGAILGYPVSHIKVTPKCVRIFPNTTFASIRQAAYQAVQYLLKNTSGCLLQPVMDVTITLPPQYVGAVSRDLTGTRRGSISEMINVDQQVKIECVVALSQLVGYASALRGMTHGSGEFTMVLRGYEPVPGDQQLQIVQSIRGY